MAAPPEQRSRPAPAAARPRRARAGLALGALLARAAGASVLRAEGAGGLCGESSSPGVSDYWDYLEGGADWMMGQCCQGRGQSPLNVSAVPDAPRGLAPTLYWGYSLVERPLAMLNTGRVLTAALEPAAGMFSVGSDFPEDIADTYAAWRLEVHTPSEHTYGGEQVPLELQIYHRRRGVDSDAPGAEDVAVLSFGFVSGGQPSGFLDALRQGGLPQRAGVQSMVNARAPAGLDFGMLFSAGRRSDRTRFWQYAGSLTAPPCTSGIQWFVRQDALFADPAAIESFRQATLATTPLQQIVLGNARRLQPVCGRTKAALDAEGVNVAEFEQALQAAEYQNSGFEDSLANAQAAREAFGRSLHTLEAPAPPYDLCVQRIAAATAQLAAARARERQACLRAQAGQQVLGASTGVNYIAAGRRLNGWRALCAQYAETIAALSAEVEGGDGRCEQLAPSERGERPR